MKKALIITTVSGFLMKFELQNVQILQSMGYEVHYATNIYVMKYDFDMEELQRQNIKIHHIPIEKSPFQFRQNRNALKLLEQIIRTERIQMIHCHTPVGGLLGRLAGHRCKELKVKVIYTAHGFHFYKGCPIPAYMIYHTAEKFLAKYTDAMVLINQEDFKSASEFHLKKDGQVYRIPGVGLDLDKFHPLSEKDRQALRRQMGIKDFQILFLSVGELNQNKNHIVVLDALCRMREQGVDLGSFRYIICGDGPYRKNLKQSVEERDLQQVVTLYGYCNRPEDMCGAADLFFFPSRREGLGMAALEALACGVPVIAADNRGSREYILPEKNGYACRWNIPEDYISAFEKWNSLTQTEKRQMKNICRASVGKFHKKNSVRVMQKVYQKMDELINESGE